MSFCVKTHDVELLAGDGIDAPNTLPGTVRGQAYLGSHRDYIVDVGQDVLIAAPAELCGPQRIEGEGEVQGRAMSRPCQLKRVRCQR